MADKTLPSLYDMLMPHGLPMKAGHRTCGTAVRFTHACQEKKVYNTQKVAVTMAEPRHTKVCLTVEVLPTTEPHESVIDVQRQHWSPLAVVIA